MHHCQLLSYPRDGQPYHSRAPQPTETGSVTHCSRSRSPSPNLYHTPGTTVRPGSTHQKVTQAERWDLKATVLLRIYNVPRPEDLPEIWQTLYPLTKEKARPVFKISIIESAGAFRCKAPRSTHAVAVILLGLHFYTKDPYCVNDTVNIFQLPDLSLSAGSEASMVTRIWDTAMDANTLTSYTDVSALMKQHRTPP